MPEVPAITTALFPLKEKESASEVAIVFAVKIWLGSKWLHVQKQYKCQIWAYSNISKASASLS